MAEREQREWERARYIGYLAVMPHVSSKRRLRITDLGRFPWEKVVKPEFEARTEDQERKHEQAKALLLQHAKKRGL